MNIVVIGATGNIGRPVVDEALPQPRAIRRKWHLARA